MGHKTPEDIKKEIEQLFDNLPNKFPKEPDTIEGGKSTAAIDRTIAAAKKLFTEESSLSSFKQLTPGTLSFGLTRATTILDKISNDSDVSYRAKHDFENRLYLEFMRQSHKVFEEKAVAKCEPAPPPSRRFGRG